MKRMEQYKAQEQAVFRGVAKALLLGIAVVFLALAILCGSCYTYLQVESAKAKTQAEEYRIKAEQRRIENLRQLYN